MGGRRRSSAWISSDLRQQLADEAARLMAEHGIQDFALAKRKAAERLGVRSSESALPSNAQIHERLVERQRIFEPEAHDRLLEKLRLVASDVMGVLDDFRPKLVGPVLEGTVTVKVSDGKPGRDTVKVESARLSKDSKTVELKLTDMRPAMQLQVQYNLEDGEGKVVKGDVQATVHALGDAASPP